MKQTKLIFATVATCLLLGAGNAFAQRSHNSGSASSSPASTKSVSAAPSSSKSVSAASSSSNAHSSNSTAVRNEKNSPRRVERGPVATSSPNKHLQPHKVTPSANYHKQPQHGQVVPMKKATKKAHVIKHHTGDYYYRDGIFYRYHNNKYVIHHPHVGFRVASIPSYRTVWVNGVSYYYYYGTFYTYMAPSREYVVVAPPVGAIVESIPEGYEKIDINGNTYYTVGGVQYKAVIFNGEIWYEVIKVDDGY
ncbi:MAG: DUF6515 family protein [Paludibacteraceae bacterium]|nr:DUF6515 family protein [Paludibacteraceae bacterium]